MVLSAMAPAAADTTTGIAGQILREDGTPVAGATVQATPESGDAATTTTDATGHYVLTTHPGAHRLLATPGAADDDLAPRQVQVAVESGRRTTRDVVLRAGNLFGVVRGADGQPVAAARVHVRPHSDEEVVVQSAGDGSFRLTVPGGELQIWAEPPPTVAPHRHAGSKPRHAEVPVGGVLADLALQLRPVAVTGRVLGPDDTPVVGARVEVESPPNPDGSSSWDSAETGADGTFAAALDTSGAVAVVVRPPLANPAGWGQVKLSTTYDGTATTTVPDVVLPDAHNVSGRVLRGTGEPAVGVDVSLTGWDTADEFVHLVTQTDAAGAYRLVAPASHPRYGYTVQASLPGDSNVLLDAESASFQVADTAVVVPDLTMVTPVVRGHVRA